ncbi:hypothetical protein [Ligilactobacillus apodemi]|nr:hypothetical protein [Ligilactobacillus apodemi]
MTGMEENKGALILLVMLGVAIGSWSAAITIAMLFLSLPVIVYSGIRHEPWLEHFFEP